MMFLGPHLGKDSDSQIAPSTLILQESRAIHVGGHGGHFLVTVVMDCLQ
jgi:acid stress-induced BolA-like protein IbaG/YrbA